MLISYSPSKLTVLTGFIICLFPFTQFSSISVSSSNNGPDVIIKFARKFFSIFPNLSPRFRDLAGTIVRDSIAFFMLSPCLTAVLKFSRKSSVLFIPEEVTMNSMLFSSNIFRLAGA